MRILLLICLFLCSCGSMPTASLAGDPYLPEMTNRPSMAFDVDGVKYNNYAILDKKSMYMFTFSAPKDTLRFMITTCNREEYFPKPSGGVVKFGYVPLTYIEDTKSCIMTATAITATGDTTTAIIEFKNSESLIASSKCNGRFNLRTGVDLCIGRAGLFQRIEFNYEIVFVAGKGCPDLDVAFGFNSYEYKLPIGFCVYKFLDKDKKEFRLTTFGYTTIKDAL